MGKGRITGLFCFDGPLYKDKNGVYCSITLTDEMISRYFEVIDFLYIVVRTFESDKAYTELNMKPLTLKNIQVVEVNNLNSFKGILTKHHFEKKVLKYVLNSNMIFARMPSIISNSVIKIAKKIKKEYLVEVGGCAWDSYWNHGILGKIIAPIMYFEEKINVRDAAFAIYVTEVFLQKRYPNNNLTASCSNVYINNQSDNVLENRIKKIKNSNFKKIIIGQAVNSIDVKYKGEHLILYAMKELEKYGYNIEFQVAGPGSGDFLISLSKKLKIENKLKLLGVMKKEELIEWMKNIDLYVQPSKQEGLPRSVIEAMSVACPCLGSNIAGIPELLDKECLFIPNNIGQISEKIEYIMSRDILIYQAKHNFDKAKKYNIESITEKRNDIFKQYRKSIFDIANK